METLQLHEHDQRNIVHETTYNDDGGFNLCRIRTELLSKSFVIMSVTN